MVENPPSRFFIDETEARDTGRFIIAWRWLETSITLLCVVLHQAGNGSEFERRSAPRSLARKLSMIEQCFESDPRLAFRADVAPVLTKVITAIAGERDFIVHHTSMKIYDDLPAIRALLDRAKWPDPPLDRDIRPLHDLHVAELVECVFDVEPLVTFLLSETIDALSFDQNQKPSRKRKGGFP